MKNLMGPILEDAKKYPPKNLNATVDFINDPMVNPMTMKNILLNPEDYRDSQLQEIFRKKYKEILHETVVNNTYWNIFINPRTVSMFAAVLSNVPYGYEERLMVNKICTQFKYHCPKENFEQVSNIIINNLGGMVNIRDIREVAAAVPELNYEQATMIGIFRCHDTADHKNFAAINDYLTTISPKIITPTNVVKIYESLGNYGKVSISTLLSVVMLNPKTVQQGYHQKAVESDANILYAVLSILNECPSNHIISAIMKYDTNYKAYSRQARGPISEVVPMFPRINLAVHNLRSQGYMIN